MFCCFSLLFICVFPPLSTRAHHSLCGQSVWENSGCSCRMPQLGHTLPAPLPHAATGPQGELYYTIYYYYCIAIDNISASVNLSLRSFPFSHPSMHPSLHMSLCPIPFIHLLSINSISDSLPLPSPLSFPPSLSLYRRIRGEAKKCRKVYGIEHRDQWCTACRWKKACQRFLD